MSRLTLLDRIKNLLLGMTDHGDGRGRDSNVEMEKVWKRGKRLANLSAELGAQAGGLRVVTLAALAGETGYFELHKLSSILLSSSLLPLPKSPRSLLTLVFSELRFVQYDFDTRCEFNSDFKSKLLLLPTSTQQRGSR